MSTFETSSIAPLVGGGLVERGLSRARVLSLAAALCLAGTAAHGAEPAVEPLPAAVGLRAGDWLVHGRIIGMVPTERTSRIEAIGGRIDTPAALLPDVDLSYFLTDHIAVSGQAGAIRTRPMIRDSLVGDIAIGSIWNAAVSGVVRYHFLPGARFNPYLGVGVSATTPVAVRPAPGISAFTVPSQTSPLLQAGFDHHLTGNWFANVMVKYVFVPPVAYEIAGVKVKTDLNMLVLGAGLGYRF
ncbi:hypothetical protein ASF22_01600 [Methylobacterium sp. Leaf87]|uniref:OmpW/AlkL family protein n=1 Tax=Methylobacterium sp. Leaf87 TaxID=1736243 RepID=UPI0006F47972|nr:OmpW family outer membrane protein [Methylobacterium sp. Leaf87]KQO73055.1 hypothetical protein ASF22_01600 [Methylobacterium sp. Leaf87]